MTPLPGEPPFFGRTTELADLRKRIVHRGMTVVTGRPQIGKSRLLRELRDDLKRENKFLVGYHQASATQNTLLYATAELYQQALADSNWRDQFHILYKQSGSGWTARVGLAIGKVLADTTGRAKGIFNETFSTLGEAAETLRTGGMRTTLAPIATEEIKSLLELAGLVDKNRPLLLIIDQWEDGQDIDGDAVHLLSFLKETQDWPPNLHIILHLRHPADDETHQDAICAWKKIKGFKKESAAVKDYELPEINFNQDGIREELLKWLRDLFPFISEVAEEDIIKLVDGYPAVLKRWLDGQPTDLDHLKELAKDAHALLYPELENILRSLLTEWNSKDENSALDVALRFILLPIPHDQQTWDHIRPYVLHGASPHLLDHFKSIGLLDRESAIPSLGLPKRVEAASTLAIEDEILSPHTKRVLISLIGEFTSVFQSPEDEKSLVAVGILAVLDGAAIRLKVTARPAALTTAAVTLFGPYLISMRVDIFYSNVIADSTELNNGEAKLLAIGMVNALYMAKHENKLLLRDKLLKELRILDLNYPDDPLVRKSLAIGLFHTVYNAIAEGNLEHRDKLLEELRTLTRKYPGDPAIREQLAISLFNTLHKLENIDNLVQREKLMEELEILYHEFPDEPAILAGLLGSLYIDIIRIGEGLDKEGADMERLLSVMTKIEYLIPIAKDLRKRNPHPRLVQVLQQIP